MANFWVSFEELTGLKPTISVLTVILSGMVAWLITERRIGYDRRREMQRISRENASHLRAVSAALGRLSERAGDRASELEEFGDAVLTFDEINKTEIQLPSIIDSPDTYKALDDDIDDELFKHLDNIGSQVDDLSDLLFKYLSENSRSPELGSIIRVLKSVSQDCAEARDEVEAVKTRVKKLLPNAR